MFLHKLIIPVRQSTLWLILVITIISTNSTLAVEANPEHQKYLTDFVGSTPTAGTMDYSVLTQKELKKELKKLKEEDPELYNKIKQDFPEPNVAGRVAIGLLVTLAAISLGLLAGCLLYSLEE